MDQFATEEQQVEAIKRFWKENGLAIVAGAVIGLGGLWGWRYYNTSQMEAKENASVAYQNAIEEMVSSESPDQLNEFAESTTQSAYQSMSGLVLAQQAAQSGDLTAAVDHLQNVMVQQADKPLAHVAALRLAQVQLELGEFDGALTTLGNVTLDAFQSDALVLKGDAYAQLARFDDARQSYVAALELSPDNRLIQMKLDNLALAAGA